MSQRARALVERLRKEADPHRLGGQNPAQNKAIGTIFQILDELAPPAEAREEDSVAEETASEPETGAEPDPAADVGGDPAVDEDAGEDESGPSGMTTENSPT